MNMEAAFLVLTVMWGMSSGSVPIQSDGTEMQVEGLVAHEARRQPDVT